MSLLLSGTMATPARRQAFVRRLLATEGTREREIAGELLLAAFEAHSWTHLGGFNFGARSRGPGWLPRNEAERRSWYTDFLGLLAPLLAGSGESREWAKSLIASKFDSLWSFAGCDDELEALVSTYGAGGTWPKLWLAIGQTLELRGAEFRSDTRARLETMHASAAPADLTSEIETYGFSNEWDLLRYRGRSYEAAANALRQRVVSLGEALWRQPALLEHLSPRIWSTHVNPLAWLGEGFAAAADSHTELLNRVLESFEEHAPERASIAFLAGCLVAMHRAEPRAVPGALNRLLDVPKLHPYRVALLVATPVTEWSSARLVELAKVGETTAWEFEALSLGRRHEPMSDTDMAALLNALCALPHGYVSALRILVMRLHMPHEWDYKPGPEIFAAARNALAHLLRDDRASVNGSEFYGLEQILAIAVGPDAPDHEVRELITTMCDGLRVHRLSFLDLSGVTSAFVRARPEMLMEALFERDAEAFDTADWLFRERSGHRAPSLNLAPIHRLLGWSGKDDERLTFVAKNIHVYVPGNKDPDCEDAPTDLKLSDHFKALMEAATDKRPMIERAVEQAVPSSWMNSRVPIIQARRDALEDLLSYPSIEVQSLVREKLAWLDGRIERERASEESDHHRWEQRFE